MGRWNNGVDKAYHIADHEAPSATTIGYWQCIEAPQLAPSRDKRRRLSCLKLLVNLAGHIYPITTTIPSEMVQKWDSSEGKPRNSHIA